MFSSVLRSLNYKTCGMPKNLQRQFSNLSVMKICGKSSLTVKTSRTSQFSARVFSTNIDFIESTKKGNALLSQEEMNEFMAVFPSVVRDLTEDEFSKTSVVGPHFAKLLDYMVPNGKKNRAVILVAAYKMLEQKQKLTPENVRLANLLGWVIELYGSFLVLIDDIVDQSDTRRGAPAWHTIEGRNYESISDGLYLEQATYFLLRKYFSNLPCFVHLVQLLLDTGFKTVQGEILDCMSNPNQKPNWKLFTMNNFKTVAKYKTTYYTFHLPIFAAMYLANINDITVQKQVEDVLIQLGEFYQIQNDFWDCYKDSRLTGRDGNDIREGKCTWFAVLAMEKANAEQRRIMMENYGQLNAEAENAVRKVYDELDLQSCYAEYEEKSFNKIHNDIEKISNKFPYELLFNVVEKIYKKL